MKIGDYITIQNEIAIKNNFRSLDFVLPKGFIICCYCLDGKIILMEANGRGGTKSHEFKNDEIFKCTINSVIRKTKKESLIKRIKNIF